MRSRLHHCLLILAFVAAAMGCIWDYDTLRDERRGLPGVAEAINGRFEKRSRFFYEDRVARMQELLATDLNNLDASDNLAVALFRTDQFEKAVAVLQDKEKRFPNQYTTASNLATFYMLHGQVEPAIPLLQKALSINPNAHFGREKYQLKLAEFLVKAKSQPEYPVDDFLHTHVNYWSNWNSPPQSAPQEKEAIDAIVGMIRFGTDQSPDLFLALGNLLVNRGDRHLAVRAYQRAIDLHHPQAKQIQFGLNQVRRNIPDEESPHDDPQIIAYERSAGEAWAKSYMDFSDGLIRAGKDPEDGANYADFYRTAGPAVINIPPDPTHFLSRFSRGELIAAATLVTALLAIIFKTFRDRRREKSSKPAGI